MRKKLIVICSLIILLAVAAGGYALLHDQNTSSVRPKVTEGPGLGGTMVGR